MKTAAVIAEYNPFHNGHAWQLQAVREISAPDCLAVVMSGDYVQRGVPAILDKHVRAEMALRCGADLVLELPCAAAAGSAQRFADGALAVLEGLGVVDELWFGSEAGTLEPFLALTDVLCEEPEDYRLALRRALQRGATFPAARTEALAGFFRERRGTPACLDDIPRFLASPNNILGLEYCLAIRRRNSTIRPRTLPRQESGYHQQELSTRFSSATAIRKALLSGKPDAVRTQVPPEVFPLLQDARKSSCLMTEDDFSLPLISQLLRETPDSLSRYLDIPADLAARIFRLRNSFTSFSRYADLVKTRNLTRTAVNRALLHILLGLTPEDAERSSAPSFVRMLGFRSGCTLFPAVKQAGKLHLVTRPAALAAGQYDKELFASSLYGTVQSLKSGQPFVHEYSRQICIL
jgi:predicted nucleotidyltransferase